MNMFTKKQRLYIIEDYEPEDILKNEKDKIVIRACNINDIKIFEGTYTISMLDWGEVKTTLVCNDYICEKFYKDFDDYRCGREKRNKKQF